MFVDVIIKKITGKLIDVLFPSQSDKAFRFKKELITNVLKALSVIDSYLRESENLKSIFQSNLLNDNSIFFDIKTEDAVKRLDSLSRELGEILSEIDVIEIYNKELSIDLQEALALERPIRWNKAFDSFLVPIEDRKDQSRLDLNYNPEKKQISITNFGQSVDLHGCTNHNTQYSSYNLEIVDDKLMVIEIITDVQKNIKTSYEHLEMYIKENFDIAEVYGVKKEMITNT